MVELKAPSNYIGKTSQEWQVALSEKILQAKASDKYY